MEYLTDQIGSLCIQAEIEGQKKGVSGGKGIMGEKTVVLGFL